MKITQHQKDELIDALNYLDEMADYSTTEDEKTTQEYNYKMLMDFIQNLPTQEQACFCSDTDLSIPHLQSDHNK